MEGLEALQDGRYTEAEQIFTELVVNIRRLFGEDHYEMAIALEGLASALDGQQKPTEAAKYRDLASEVWRKHNQKNDSPGGNETR